jgi:hypothetical protein
MHLVLTFIDVRSDILRFGLVVRITCRQHISDRWIEIEQCKKAADFYFKKSIISSLKSGWPNLSQPVNNVLTK